MTQPGLRREIVLRAPGLVSRHGNQLALKAPMRVPSANRTVVGIANNENEAMYSDCHCRQYAPHWSCIGAGAGSPYAGPQKQCGYRDRNALSVARVAVVAAVVD